MPHPLISTSLHRQAATCGGVTTGRARHPLPSSQKERHADTQRARLAEEETQPQRLSLQLSGSLHSSVIPQTGHSRCLLQDLDGAQGTKESHASTPMDTHASAMTSSSHYLSTETRLRWDQKCSHQGRSLSLRRGIKVSLSLLMRSSSRSTTTL